MRLIDADALKQALKSNCKPELCPDYKNCWCEACCPHNDFVDLIDDAPTVEEKSYAMGYQDGLEDGLQDIRPQGKWITRTDDNGVNYRFYCSCCDREVMLITDYFHYCGARMEMREGTE